MPIGQLHGYSDNPVDYSPTRPESAPRPVGGNAGAVLLRFDTIFSFVPSHRAESAVNPGWIQCSCTQGLTQIVSDRPGPGIPEASGRRFPSGIVARSGVDGGPWGRSPASSPLRLSRSLPPSPTAPAGPYGPRRGFAAFPPIEGPGLRSSPKTGPYHIRYWAQKCRFLNLGPESRTTGVLSSKPPSGGLGGSRPTQ